MMSGDMRIAAMFAFTGIDMNGHFDERRHGVKQLMTNVFGDFMALAGWHLAIHGNVKLGALAMPDPTHCHIMHIHHIFIR
jgi:hypothetical protein